VNTDSVATILARINASTAGVTAGYDRLNDRFTLSNKTTGDTGIAVSEGAGGLLGALGLTSSSTLVRGKNALFSVDGGQILTSASNTLNQDAHGIAGLTLTAASVSAQTVTVAGNTGGVRSKIEDFISKFNAVESYIDQQTAISTGSNGKVTAALFASNHEFGDIGAALRKQVFAAVPGLSGNIKRLADIGIDFTSGTNQLAVNDSTKLDAAIAGHGDDVRTLFSSSTDGLVTRLSAYLTQVTGSSGSIATETSSLASQSKSLDDQIAAMERHITQQQTILTNSFVHMETAQSAIQSQLSALNSAFGLNTSGK
jgi:flagellar hook-associated protein 2